MKNKKAIIELKEKDPVLGKIIDSVGLLEIPQERESPFYVLVKSIIYQQLAGKAAKAIFNRFLGLCRYNISPKNVFRLPSKKLKEIGIPERKITYIKELSDQFINGELNSFQFSEKSNEEIIKKLTSVKGIGPWTAEMFLMFYLGREDVFSIKDLGLHKTICKLYGKKFPMKKQELEEISLKWKPYRTLACLYLWKIKDAKEIW